MYGTPMPVTFILLDTLEYNTIRVPTRFHNYILVLQLLEKVSQDLRDPRNRLPGTYSIQELNHGSSLLIGDTGIWGIHHRMPRELEKAYCTGLS